MNVTTAALEKLDQHWAIRAVGAPQIEKATKLSNLMLVNRAVGDQINFNYEPSASDYDLLRKVSMAYEVAAIEGLNDFLTQTSGDESFREQCASGAYRAFELRRLLTMPAEAERRMYHILHVSSLAYCGDRWTDLRRWYNENEDVVHIPSAANTSWDGQLRSQLFECWVRLFRKKRWEDLNRISEIIGKLREDQQRNETDLLGPSSGAGTPALALRLISLYHWAKATEILAGYVLQGEPAAVTTRLNRHFERAIQTATACADPQLEMLLRWLHVAGRQMISDSIWRVGNRINSRVTKFIKVATRQQALFELMPPQRVAIQNQGLLDQAATAIVVDMPTSGGKTLLAQFRILQALNQFDQDESGKGWVAYVAPTKALTAQITRRLRRDFEPIGVSVQQLTGAIEIDAFEEDILAQTKKEDAFDVLVATPEKLQLVIRNKKVSRPLALVVMDEAHNIEDETRGLRIELLLATIKGECNAANFLLLMPFVENPAALSRWLAQDASAGRSISLGTVPWKPNERIVGIFNAEADRSERAGWRLQYRTLVTTRKTIHLAGVHAVGNSRPLGLRRSDVLAKDKQKGMTLQTAAMAQIVGTRGTSIAVANNTQWVWSMARQICAGTQPYEDTPDEIRLVQKFLRSEISEHFELIEMLNHGVGVHQAGLSDEVRALMEWLAEEGKLKVLCATTTVAQGVNFPVSSVFLASHKYPRGKEMSPREFWNLAGRAGRMGQDSVGVVGIAAGTDSEKVVEFVSRATGELASRLVQMLDTLEGAGKLNDLAAVFQEEQWADFRCYIAHLWSEKGNIDEVLADTEQLLRNTFGYQLLENRPEQRQKAEMLLDVAKRYARSLSEYPGRASLADMTGFSPEGIGRALAGMGSLEHKPTVRDWMPESLFGAQSGMADLYGVMLTIPQLKDNLEQIVGGSGVEGRQIADITKAWVNGTSIEDIARNYFKAGGDETKELTDACKAIYKTVVNSGTWGMSALTRLSGIEFETLTERQVRQIGMIPAMIYHGVQSEEGVLLRMNAVPRTIAEPLGNAMRDSVSEADLTVQGTRSFLKKCDISVWNRSVPEAAFLSGAEYRHVWTILAGED